MVLTVLMVLIVLIVFNSINSINSINSVNCSFGVTAMGSAFLVSSISSMTSAALNGVTAV